MQGTYCHQCGQKAVSLHLGVHDFAHEATHEFLHLDGKILKTVKLLVLQPGQLSKEFVEGRRARYISPLRVYLTFSLLFFFLAAVAPRGEGVIDIGPGPHATLPQNAEQERVADEIATLLQKQLPRAMFLLMPLYGLLTLAFYRRAQPYYVPHLYYSVHMHAFMFLLMSVVALLGFGGMYGKAAGIILTFVCIPYHYLALRRFFGESRGKTAWKGTAIGLAYLFVILTFLTGLAIYTMVKNDQRSGSSKARPTIVGSTERSRYSHTARASG